MLHMKCRIHKSSNSLQTRTALHHFGPLPNHVKILFTAVGNGGDRMASANSFNLPPLLLTHEDFMLPLTRMVAHQTDVQWIRSASLPKFVKETLVRFAPTAA